MNPFVKILVTAVAVAVGAYLLPGVGIDNFFVAIVAAIVLAVLNVFVKPLLIIFTIPVTILTLGLFLLVINALIILLADAIVPGFHVDGFWWALLFSLIISLINAIFEEVGKD